MTNPSTPAIRPATMAALSLLTWHYCDATAQANPTGGTVAQGTASFSSIGSQLTVNVATTAAAINWQSFNIGAGETTTFVQPSSSSVVWNQINDGNPSQIMGSLNANGYVILQNQNGFAIGGSAAISAHGLIMTTSPTPPPSLASGGAWTFNAPPLGAKIVNYGQINITGGGSAFLIANDIENQGIISAPGGKIGLYAGEQVLISQSADGLALSTPVTLPQGSVDNEGKLIADAGAIAAQAQTVNQNGLIQANTAQYVNGSIELVAGDSLTLGTKSDLEANGLASTSAGGTVNLQAGDTLEAQAGSQINVTGIAQGGQTTVTVTSGNALDLEQGSSIIAEGGKISLQAATENNAGKLIADAGTIAIQAQTLNQNGLIQANSAQFDNGSIQLVASDSLTLGANSDLEANGLTLTSSGGTVSLQAGGNLEAQAGSIINVSGSAQGGVIGQTAAVTAQAGNTLKLDGGSAINATGGNISLQAATVNQSGRLQANSVNSVAGAINIAASGAINLGAASDIEAHGDNRAANTAASPGGSVSLQAGTGFADQSGSVINVSGSTAGGAGGQTAISAPQITALNSSINGQANTGFADGTLAIDTDNILLNSDGSAAPGNLALNVNSLASGLSQITLQAAGNLELNAQWNVPGRNGQLDTVSLLAGNTLAVDSGAGLNVAGGKIALNAASVTLNGTLQANSVGAANGVIEVVASGAISLGQNAVISATGDATATGPSPGGFVVLQAGTTFSDTATSTMNVSGGTGGGVPGIVEIFGNNVTDGSSIQSQIDGLSAAQFNAQDFLLLNPYDLTISTKPTSTASAAPTATTASVPANLNISDLNNYSQIDIHALDNIEFGAQINPTVQTVWNLQDPGSPAALDLSAGNSIILDGNTEINAGNHWGVNLTAGTGFAPTTALPAPAAGSDGIYLNGTASLATENGNINLWAANEVLINSDTGSAGDNGIRTLAGGNINVITEYGNVNTGGNANGYNYGSIAPYATPSPTLGGISTVAGGNVVINAGGNVLSFLATDSTTPGDGGTGAFGPEPGDVTIHAGGNVYGHYVLANGVGTITAGNDIGILPGNPVPNVTSEFALSLIDGAWSLNAPNGNIYLQEVRNPNGIFNTSNKDNKPYDHLFNYGPQAAVNLTAGEGVYLTGVLGQGSSLPRPAQDAVQVIYPPILNISAGEGGVNLLGPVTLFPSVYQSLSITTTGKGDLTGVAGEAIPTELLMSDSSQTSWNGSSTITPFSDTDHSAGLPVQAANPNSVILNISGDIDDLQLVTSKATEITVAGNMTDCAFSGQNLAASDVTSITVDGAIVNAGSYFSVSQVSIPGVPDTDLLPGMSSSWNNIFTLAVNPAALANVVLTPTTTAQDILEAASLFGVSVQNKQLVGNTENFYYDQASETLALQGPINSTAYQALGTPGQTIYVLHLVNGQPQVGANGQLELDPVSWAPTSVVDTLATDSQNSAPSGSVSLGYRVGGPGQFDINANSISLGDSSGILSCGVNDPDNGLSRYADLASVTSSGASVNVTVAGDLSMVSSTIASLGGGNVNVTSTGGSIDLGVQELAATSLTQPGQGIFTSGAGNVNVTAFGDINIDGSRIGTYNGGNINVESLDGTVNIGSTSPTYHGVYVSYVNAQGEAAYYAEYVLGSGIAANTLVPPGSDQTWPPNPAKAPGNITVEAPHGDIIATLGGITQESLGAVTPAGPVITLTAGTAGVTYIKDPSGQLKDSAGNIDYGLIVNGVFTPEGNIDLGNGGVLGGEVNLTAYGNLVASIIARQNSNVTAAQNVNVSIVAGGQADVSGGGSVVGVVVGVGGASVSGESVTAAVLGQDVSVNGSASQSTLGSSAAATSTSQAAANQSDAQAKEQLANDSSTADDDNKKKKLLPVIQRVKRVTVILPDKT